MRTINVPELNVIGEQYESFDEFYKVNEARELNPNYTTDYNSGKGSSRNVKGDTSYTWDETKHDMKFGSSLFDEEFAKMMKEVENDMPSEWKRGMRNRSEKSVVGQSVSVGRALVNNPRAFNRRRPHRIKHKAISFFFSISCPWFTPTEDRLKAGCILMVICQRLETLGYQTRIYYSPDFSSGKQNGHDNPQYPSQVCMLMLKDFPTRFNLKKMQFPLASESALFQVGCWWNHRFPGTTFDWGSGEGYSVDNSPERLGNAKKFALMHDSIYLSVPIMRNDFKLNLMAIYDYVMNSIGEM